MSTEPNHHERPTGKTPVLSVIPIAWLQAWKARFPFLSCDDVASDLPEESRSTQSGPDRRIAPTLGFSESDRQFMLELARKSLTTAILTDGTFEVDVHSLLPAMTEKRACFVTLRKEGSLRGCIGNIFPKKSLYQAVLDNARNAALRDPRFPPVDRDELEQIRIEISVLSDPELLVFNSPEQLLEILQPGIHGVLLRVDGRLATFLPQVWDEITDKAHFLNHLCRKAGCAPAAWRGNDAEISVYYVQCFEEEHAPVV